jgi:hypothetical protein
VAPAVKARRAYDRYESESRGFNADFFAVKRKKEPFSALPNTGKNLFRLGEKSTTVFSRFKSVRAVKYRSFLERGAGETFCSRKVSPA